MIGHASNFGLVTLGADLSAVATSLTLSPGDNSLIPLDGDDGPLVPFALALWDTDFANPAKTGVRELIQVGAVAGLDCSTLTRGVGGTTARAWLAGQKAYVCNLASYWNFIALCVNPKPFQRFNPTTGEMEYKADNDQWYVKRLQVTSAGVIPVYQLPA